MGKLNIGTLSMQLAAETAGMRRAQQETNGILSQLDRRMAATGQAAAAMFGAGAAAAATAFGGRALIQATAELDRMRQTLDAVHGANAAAEMAFVTQEASRLGLELTSTAQAYGRFTAATKGTALEGQQSRDIFSAVAGAAARLGLSAEESTGALKALEQMMSKGTVQAEELRGQLGDRIPKAFGLAAKAMGVTEKELGKMMEQGQVMAADLLPKLAHELENSFGVEGRVESTVASMNRLANVVREVQGDLASRGLGQAFNASVDIVEKQTAALTTGIEYLAVAIGSSLAGRAMQALYGSAQQATAALASVEKAELATARAAEAGAWANQSKAAQAVKSSTIAKQEAQLQMKLAEMELARIDAVIAKEGNSANLKKLRQSAYQQFMVAQRGVIKAANDEAVAIERLNVVHGETIVKSEAATAAQLKLAAATRATTVAANLASRTLKGGLALIGGWQGATIIAAYGLYQFATRASEAGEEARRAAEAIDALREGMDRLDAKTKADRITTASLKIQNLTTDIGKLQREIDAIPKTTFDPFTGESVPNTRGLDKIAELQAKMRELQIQRGENESVIKEISMAQSRLAASTTQATAATVSATDATERMIQSLRQEQAELKAILAGNEAMVPLIRARAEIEEAIAAAKAKGDTEAVSRMEKERAGIEALVKENIDLQAAIDARAEANRKAAEAEAEAERTRNQLRDEGKRLAEQLATPMEKYAADLAEIDKLLKAEAISAEIANRARQSAADRLASINAPYAEYIKNLREETQLLLLRARGQGVAADEMEARLQLEQQLGRGLTANESGELAKELAYRRAANAEFQRSNDLQQFADQVKQQTMTANEKLAETERMLNEARGAGKITLDQYNKALTQARLEASQLDDIAKQFGGTAVDAFADAIVEGQKFKDVVKELTKELIKMAIKMAAMKAFEMALSAGMGGAGGGGGSAGASATPSPGIQAMARGGVINAPTLIGHRRGTALAGEAGAEAILPLTRTGGGLGVNAAGIGGHGDVVLNVINKGEPVTATERRATGPNGELEIELVIEKAVKKSLKQGRLDQDFNAAFGMRRQGQARA